jgi:hypothetical protein
MIHQAIKDCKTKEDTRRNFAHTRNDTAAFTPHPNKEKRRPGDQ